VIQIQIACFGDSLTEGAPGVGFFKLLEKDFPGHSFYNYGKIGDTVISLYERLRQTAPDKYDISFLWVGGNDVLAKILYKSSILGQEPDQKPSKTVEEFVDYYKRTLNLLLLNSRHIIAVSPLTVGEDFNNEWNMQMEQLSLAIKQLIAEYSNVTYIDIRSEFAGILKNHKSSDYFTKSAIGILRDIARLKTPEQVDQKSLERGLVLTLDGIHLNSKGAQLVREIFGKAICRIEPDLADRPACY
jgi:lysophospholipase L1-like esterase